jgi:CrcB protein
VAVSDPEIVDSDVDLHDPNQRAEVRPRQWDLVLAIAFGGIVGAEGRYGLGKWIPHQGGSFPWSTVIINATGCLLIGVLMVVILELTSPHRLLRPFLGVGVLGGYTTFSTFAVDTEGLVQNHRPAVALWYVLVTLALCLVAVFAATILTRVIGHAVLERGLRLRERGRIR